MFIQQSLQINSNMHTERKQHKDTMLTLHITANDGADGRDTEHAPKKKYK